MVPVKRNRALELLLLILVGLFIIFYTRQLPDEKLSYMNVLNDLQNLEQIARGNGNSRAVAKGHSASVDYVISELNLLNSSLKWTTQDVVVGAQVDEIPPVVVLHHNNENITLAPRIDVQTLVGSGSARFTNLPLQFISNCDTVTNGSFVAIIDIEKSNPKCNPCERMSNSIKNGAEAVIFLFSRVHGYPFGLPPRQRGCRDGKYLEISKQAAILSISDRATDSLLRMMVAQSSTTLSIAVTSAYRDFVTRNVIAESINGNSSSIALFGSHLDSVRSGPGINDDGSGAMATLELARYFHRTSLSINTVQKIRFAWWTAEGISM